MKLKWLFSNPVNLWITTNQAWVVSAAGFLFVLSLLLPPQVRWAPVLTLAALSAWLPSHCFSTLHWLRRSRRLGLRNLLLRAVPADQFSYLAARRGIQIGIVAPVLEVHTWTNTSYRKKGGISQYQEDLEYDAERLAQLLRDGTLRYATITCNSFNRYLLRALKRAFGDFKVDYRPGVVLAPSCLKLYRERPFKRIQRKMFGWVYSQRKIDKEGQWDLLVVGVEEGEN
ncbi:MAG: hypothetical protein M0Z41_20315 [Peptococcaceae bacterium]|jgi:hypothetical protein|nr:hypothetical protein [Peptococcaceae bacterium]